MNSYLNYIFQWRIGGGGGEKILERINSRKEEVEVMHMRFHELVALGLHTGKVKAVVEKMAVGTPKALEVAEGLRNEQGLVVGAHCEPVVVVVVVVKEKVGNGNILAMVREKVTAAMALVVVLCMLAAAELARRKEEKAVES